MTTTEEDLKEAFAGESQANRKYLAFAKKAEQDGFKNVARLFRTAAEAETIHACEKNVWSRHASGRSPCGDLHSRS